MKKLYKLFFNNDKVLSKTKLKEKERYGLTLLEMTTLLISFPLTFP